MTWARALLVPVGQFDAHLCYVNYGLSAFMILR
jgi:hypothetical protein